MRSSNWFLAAIFTVFFVAQAHAQVMIEQGKVVIRANPGETIVNTLPIHNNSDKGSITLRAYWEDFMYVAPFNGEKEFSPSGTTDTSASRWVNFSPQQFTLDAKGSKLINYSIQVPQDAKGGYYGVLFFEEGGGSAQGRVGMSIVTRIGALFFIETTNSTRKGLIENLEFQDKEFKCDFSNLGDVVLIPDATFYILDKEGLVAERGEITKFYLAPGKKTPVKFTAGAKLAAGDYTAVLTFDFGGGENYTYEFDFNKAVDGSAKVTKVAS